MALRSTVRALLCAAVAIPSLAASQEAAPEVTEVADPALRARILADLGRDLERLGASARVERCSVVLDYVQPGVRDTSWGVACSLGTGRSRTEFVACDDWLVGKFSLTENLVPTRERVQAFIATSCPPGG